MNWLVQSFMLWMPCKQLHLEFFFERLQMIPASCDYRKLKGGASASSECFLIEWIAASRKQKNSILFIIEINSFMLTVACDSPYLLS
jgi:hypothetical protein